MGVAHKGIGVFKIFFCNFLLLKTSPKKCVFSCLGDICDCRMALSTVGRGKRAAKGSPQGILSLARDPRWTDAPQCSHPSWVKSTLWTSGPRPNNSGAPKSSDDHL